MELGLTHGIRRTVSLRGAGTGVIDGGIALTWQVLADRIAALAGTFHARGVGSGDRVAMMALNGHRSIETFFATLHAGGVIAPLNHRLSLGEIAAQARDAEPTLLVIDALFVQHVPALRAAAPSIRAVLQIGGTPASDVEDYDTARNGAVPSPDADRAGDDLACLFYTGGTTGEAKGVMLSHRNIMANSVNLISHVGMDERTVHLHCGPLFHVAAGVRLFSVSQAAGTHVFLPRFDAGQVIETIARANVTLATFVPTMVRALIDEPGLATHDLSSLRYITYGAAPMPEPLLREAMARLPQVRFVQAYGQTECSPIATMLGWRDHLPDAEPGRLRSAGRPALLADVIVADGDDLPLPAGEAGEILIRGPMVMQGYWRRPEDSAIALRGGWLHSGDIGRFDEAGYLHVVDRLKDMIITGGENVYSQEVETVIAAHPGVLECAVFGRPDSRWGEAVHAVVVARTDADVTAEQIAVHCRAHMAGFKCPKSIDIRRERLPLSAANKIAKTVLRTELLARETA